FAVEADLARLRLAPAGVVVTLVLEHAVDGAAALAAADAIGLPDDGQISAGEKAVARHVAAGVIELDAPRGLTARLGANAALASQAGRTLHVGRAGAALAGARGGLRRQERRAAADDERDEDEREQEVAAHDRLLPRCARRRPLVGALRTAL